MTFFNAVILPELYTLRDCLPVRFRTTATGSLPGINSTEKFTVISLSIIIPVKNEARNLEACLRSIRDARSVDLAYEILVIDNGSEDNTVDVARKFSADIHVVPDVTVAALRNFGAERAQGEVLAFIDADCTLQPDWFDSILPYIKDDSIKCFGSPPGIPEQSTWVQECWYQIRKKGSPNDPPRTCLLYTSPSPRDS